MRKSTEIKLFCIKFTTESDKNKRNECIGRKNIPPPSGNASAANTTLLLKYPNVKLNIKTNIIAIINFLTTVFEFKYVLGIILCISPFDLIT